MCGRVSLVHNGIIENYKTIKNNLIKEGYSFKSETDSEVIVNLISFYLSKNLSNKESLNKIGNINKINRSYSELEQKFERPPSADELAETLDCTPQEVKQSLSQNGRHISMDAPLVEGDNSSSSMYDVMGSKDSLPSPESNLVMESLRCDIRQSLKSLTPRESEVVSMFYGLEGKMPLSLEEIGDRFDLTRERVRQIKEKAIRRLKHTSKNVVLKSYLG